MRDINKDEHRWTSCNQTGWFNRRTVFRLLHFTAAILVCLSPITAQEVLTEYRVLVDNHNRPLPGSPPDGWYYNCMGGDRGLIRGVTDQSINGLALFTKPSKTTYKGTLQPKRGADKWEFFGFWYSLGRPISQKHQWSPAAVFHPLIRPEYQPKLIGVDVLVNQIESPHGRSDLTLKLELKGFNNSGKEVSRANRVFVGNNELIDGPFPRVFTLPVDPDKCGKVGLFTVVLDRALPEDSLEVDDITMRITMPQISPNLEPLLFSLAMLLDNYDDTTGMVQDRANFPNGDFENVTASAKLAKLLALGIKLNLVDSSARETVDKIAFTLLAKVPRGTAGLWPHFTKDGGSTRAFKTEWSSGDTSYAVLDLLVALKLIDDPNGRIPACMNFIKSINWATLYRPGQGYSHGFDAFGTPLPGTWQGFGMETLGVQLAALTGGGPQAIMNAPPSDNGSGFILHAGYPIVPAGLDRWGYDWLTLRQDEVNRQLSWYTEASHANSFLVSKGFFGLSAAERPEGWDPVDSNIYQAYGMGGSLVTVPNDGEHKVVAPHYSGMVAALVPEASLNMWTNLKDMGLVSPMNMVESLAINPENGELEEVNFLKGSWNLALFAEGWMLAQPGTAQFLEDAITGIAELNNARSQLIPPTPESPVWTPVANLPESTFVFTGAGGTILAASTTADAPRLWAADGTLDTPVFRELTFDTNMLQSAWTWSKQITSLAVRRSNGVPHFYAATSGGIMEVNPAEGVGNAMSPFWSWNWDTSDSLRTAGEALVWNVRNSGSESGSHAWNPDNGFSRLADVKPWTNNRIRSSDGTVLGWYDMRGYIWPGANPPPLLLDYYGFSADGANTWSNYLDISGNPLIAACGELWGVSPVLIVNQPDGSLLEKGIGQVFLPINFPSKYPDSLFFDEDTGLVIAGSGNALYFARHKYTVTFDSLEGTAPSPGTKNVFFSSTYGPLATTTREGYTFGGWWTGPGGTGTEVTSETVFTINTPQTLYANWIENGLEINWANPLPITYGKTLSAVQLNAKANVPGTFAYVPKLGRKLTAGNYTLSVNFTPKDKTKYKDVFKTVSLTVNKAPAKVNLTALSQVYNGQPRQVTVTTVPAKRNVKITYAGDKKAPVNAGSYAVTATVDDENYFGEKTGTLIVSKANQKITFKPPANLHYGDADCTLTATSNSGLPVSYASSNTNVATIVDGKLHIVGTGSVTITVTQNGDSNWKAASPVKRTLTVNQAIVATGISATPAENINLISTLADHQTQKVPIIGSWVVAQSGDILEIFYGEETNSTQYGALHLDSSYFRLHPGGDSGWGTSVILLPSFWSGGNLHQGAPITATWKPDGPALVISINGTISELGVQCEVRIWPPINKSISARVSVTTDGTVVLDKRPGEAFKPVMLSSMQISSESWDAQSAFADSETYPIPESGWLISPALHSATFGLNGGTSTWKTKAPTVEISLEDPMQITGWVTPSNDPNDDNVGIWAAADTVLPTWSYDITAREP